MAARRRGYRAPSGKAGLRVADTLAKAESRLAAVYGDLWDMGRITGLAAAALLAWPLGATAQPAFDDVPERIEAAARYAALPQSNAIGEFCRLTYSSRPGRDRCRDESESAVAYLSGQYQRVLENQDRHAFRAFGAVILECESSNRPNGLQDWRRAAECVQTVLASAREAGRRAQTQ
jgi:hypothetical protein